MAVPLFTLDQAKRACQERQAPRFFRVVTLEGLYEVRINTIGIFSTMIERFEYDGTPEYGEGVGMLLPKIDTSLLMQVIGSFKEVFRLYGTVEAAAEIYWSIKDQHYYVYYPKQVVTDIEIDTEVDNKREHDDVLVLELHSHHAMRADFSNKDDLNERATKFYAVVGRIEKFFPDIKLRYANAMQHREVPLETLFKNYFPVEWLDNIKVGGEDSIDSIASL